EPFRDLPRRDRILGGGAVVGPRMQDLGEGHQNIRLAFVGSELLEASQRAFGVAESTIQVALLEHEQRQVVLSEREGPLVPERLMDGHRAMRVPGRLGELPELLVVQAEMAVNE